MTSIGDLLELRHWKLVFKKGWDRHFKKFDRSIQKRILRKPDHMKQPLQARGLQESKVVVEEIGQYRMAFYQDGKKHQKEIHFVGNHKQYEKWYRQFF